ncbi:hypothetical protein SAMN04488136_13722 [Vibrio xiamenensis]|uniref:AraC family transcriptional regulator n=1 Tax=Vibrio xiamenensis TaxID=861298 RepID=A0A1G8GGU9_9VIBR|nr:hypothetical protein [Vibrio xiamenensis]SDH93571.1 hypothetical protein SAMN04488136_13722 [Vibrio xiamenensis]
MHYTISHTTERHDYLSATPRRRTFKHQLLLVRKGLVLCRLGKMEYALQAKQALWLPFDCLTSLTFFPESHIESVEISSRSSALLPSQAGYVTLSPLATALLDKLAHTKQPDARQRLLAVLLDEAQSWHPHLKADEFTKAIAEWRKYPKALPKEIQLGLTVRESQKRLLSGAALEQVVDELFNGDMQTYQQLCQLMLAKDA